MTKIKTGSIVVALALLSVAPAFASGKQIICEELKGGNFIPFHAAVFDGMRFQTLLKQAQIEYGGEINMVDYYNMSGDAGTFGNYKLYLCHTDKTSLSRTFADNYKGTPVAVAELSSFSIPSGTGWFELGMSRNFAYNNVDNLLIEIRWQGGEYSSVVIGRGTALATKLRIYAYNNPEAPIGNGDGCPYYTRLSFGAHTGVGASSLGRVKALFR